MKKVKENAGITLIALVITIIILIILAGIGISAITGDGGIIRKTQIAVNINELANLKEALDIYYVLNPNDDPVTTQVPKEEITDEVTQTKIVEYQPDADFISDIKYERLYYLDSEKLNVNDLPEKRYILDIETGVVFVNNGLEVKEDGTKTYVLAEYEKDKNKTNILAEGTKIYTGNNNTYVVKENGDMYGVGEISSYNYLGLDWKEEYDINLTPQKTDIQIVEESVATDNDFVEVIYCGGAYIFKKKNGEVWGIGNNQSGQLGLGDRIDRTELTKLPIDNVKKMYGGITNAGYILLLKNDGTLWGMGKNKWYQYNTSWSILKESEEEYITRPVQISHKINQTEQFNDIKDVSIYHMETIILKNNGEVWLNCGRNQHGNLGSTISGTVETPVRLTDFENLASTNNTTIKKIISGDTTFVLLENGYLYTVGHGGYGLLGNGSLVSTKIFGKILENVENVIMAQSKGYAQLKDGTFLGWGWDAGTNTKEQYVTTPTSMPINNIIDINYNYILTTEGKVYQIHYNSNNEYNAQYTNITAPIEKLFNYGMIDQDGYIWTFGNTILKDKGKRLYLAKSNIQNVSEIISTNISYGRELRAFIDKNNNIFAWGRNYNYTIDSSSNRIYREKIQIELSEGISQVKDIAIAATRTFIIDQNNDLWYRGNHNGGREFGASVSEKPLSTLTKHQTMSNVKEVYNYADSTIILKNDGTLWASGINNYGNVGLGHTNSVFQFTQIQKDNIGNTINFSNVKKIAGGDQSTACLLEDGTVYVWGKNTEGQLGLGHNSNVLSPTKLTFFEGKSKVIDVWTMNSSVAFLLKNGEVYVSGSNTYGQFGNGTRQDSNVPVKANITDVKEIIAGGNHIVAIKNDNSVWSWGAGAQGQLGNAKIGDELLPVPAYELAR